MGVVMHQLPIIVAEAPAHPVYGENPVEEGGGRADGHQGVHVRGAVDERFETDLEKAPVDEKHRDGQKQLGERRDQRVFLSHKNAGNGKPHHMPHGDVHEGNQNEDGGNQSGFHRLLVLQGAVLPVLPFFAEAAFSLRILLRMVLLHRRSAVADPADGLADIAFGDCIFIVGDGHVVGKEAHIDLRHAGQLTDAARDVCLTCRAGHAGDVIFFCFHSDPAFCRRRAADYFNLRISSKASSTICVFPLCTSSTTQVSMCSFRMI